MEQIIASCDTAADYPKNLINSNTYEFITNAYFDKLNERQHDLFHSEEKASLHFWEFADTGREFWPNQIRSANNLKEHFGIRCPDIQKDPKCRFIFVHAPNSREKLYTTRYMLALSLTYQQVLPGFLDFIFPFGRQDNARDFHFGGFRYQTRLFESERGTPVPQLGRSGRDYRLCYNLTAVERSKGGAEPWSVRSAAIHHSFDVQSGQASWVVVKANQLLQNRIKSATGSRGLQQVRSFETLDRAFASTLATHVLFCEWPNENWRWYINSLEEEFQGTTRRALSPIVRTPTTLATDLDQSLARNPVDIERGLGLSTMGPEKESPFPPFPTHSPLPGLHSPPDGMVEPPQNPYIPSSGIQKQQEFSFADMQRIQYIEEKANTAMLILKTNVTVLTDLKQYYQTIALLESWPSELASRCREDTLHFEQRVSTVVNDMNMQHSRTETLLRIISDRKSLLYGILETQNTEANKASSDNMQRMTADTHDIAVRTAQETISMRIITFVTLCYLPGTFISVGVLLTLMSTDIIHFPKAESGPLESVVSPRALQLYLIISLPLVVVTLGGWYLYYLWEIRPRYKPLMPNRSNNAQSNWFSPHKPLRVSGPSLLPT